MNVLSSAYTPARKLTTQSFFIIGIKSKQSIVATAVLAVIAMAGWFVWPLLNQPEQEALPSSEDSITEAAGDRVFVTTLSVTIPRQKAILRYLGTD